jgi:mannose-1-phosphate guanylyltransferase/mannose-6-phosphate isomerase
VWQSSAKDGDGNVTHGNTLMADTTNTFIHASSRLVGTLGVKNLIVVETADAILVADRSHSQNVKKLVNKLEALKRSEHILPRKVHRPWGWYDSVDESDCFKVKLIQVNPGASLSLQRHQMRAEHWVVVKGTAEVICGDKKIFLKENQSTYIPLGEVHRLSNPGAIPLEIIEIQSGSYFGEDDIERFEDNYGRL